MGKKNNNKKKEKDKSGPNLPLVSVCTPTFNRRPFIENMINCYKNQTYPRSKMEWIIVDDGTDKVKDIIEKYDNLNIKYFEVEKMNLGQKRNFMHTKANGNIIVYMDDDDYYPPERVRHSVDMLLYDKKALCAGTSEIYVYFKDLNKMIQCGPYGKTHATAGTFAFKRELLDITSYEDNAALEEERHFLKDYTIPFVQLDPLKTILVFSHMHNTFDKREMLKSSNSNSVKESKKTVEDFIKFDYEEPVKNFFLKDIDDLLSKYDFGLPKHKPDVLKQTEEIKKNRELMMSQEQQKYLSVDTGVVIEVQGKPKSLTRDEVIKLLKSQQETITNLKQNNVTIEFNRPNEPTKQLTVQELATLAQDQLNTIQIQHRLIEDYKAKIEMLENTVVEHE